MLEIFPVSIISEHGMDDQQQQDGAGLQQQQPRPGKVQLGEFWPQAPNAWFTTAELKFEVAHITGERECFAYAVGSLGFSVLCAACCAGPGGEPDCRGPLHHAEGPPGVSSPADAGPEGY